MTNAVTSHCPRCSSAAAGLGPGPYTQAEFALIALAEPPAADWVKAVHDDPGVVEARSSQELGEIALAKATSEWEDALLSHRELRLRLGAVRQGQLDRRDQRRVDALADAEEDAYRAREAASKALARARVRYQDAVRRAQARVLSNG